MLVLSYLFAAAWAVEVARTQPRGAHGTAVHIGVKESVLLNAWWI